MIAIDFGTTNSSLAVFAEGDTEPRIQKLEYGDPDSLDPNVMPSAISECKSHECRVSAITLGNEALRHYFGTRHDISLLQEMKLHFDRTTKEPPTLVETGEVRRLREEGGFLSLERRMLRQAIYEGDIPLEPRDFVPRAAMLIKGLVERATRVEDRGEAIFGVPASFQEAGKKRLREAAKRALVGDAGSYERVHLYYEPVAAARAYKYLEAGNTLVLDYGGGTLDISVIAMEAGGRFDPARVTYGGFSEGGSRMDQRILEYCLDKGGRRLSEWFSSQNILLRRRIKRNVEAAKIKLSLVPEADVEFPGSEIGSISLTRPDLALALQPIMTRMAVKIAQVVLDAVGKIENINFVVLSGGSSLNRAVQDGVLSIFGHIPPDRFVLPDAAKPQEVETCLCAVAKGLAWLRKDGFPPIDFGD